MSVLQVLDRKLLRDLRSIAGQATAIVLVVGCAVASAVMSFGVLRSLDQARAQYYERCRFADVFASLPRAPDAAAEPIRRLPGVAAVQTRLVADVALDLADTEEPIAARLISLPERGEPEVNAIVLRRGRFIRAADASEVIVSESFAGAHGLGPGDRVSVLLGERRRELAIVGVALSPEYVYALGPGMLSPDERRFGVLWAGRKLLEAALGASGEFNDLTLRVNEAAAAGEVQKQVESVLEPYGSADVHGRERQPSHAFLSAMFHQIAGVGRIAPAIFLAVAAFLVHAVLGRLIEAQRQHIGLLKALGIGEAAIVWHYLELVLVLGVTGIALGVLAGTFLGHRLLGLYAEFFHFPVLPFEHDLSAVLVACAVALAAMTLGALRGLRSVFRLAPALALAPPAPPRYGRTWLDRAAPPGPAGGTVKMVLRHLGRFPLRAALTVGGLALAVALQVSMLFSFDALDRMIAFYARTESRDFAVLFARGVAPAILDEAARWPGVLRIEGWRSVPARLGAGGEARVVNVTGLAQSAMLHTLLDAGLAPVPVPPRGLALPRKLASLLRVGVGERVALQPIGSRAAVEVPVARIIEQYIGLDAYMDLDALGAIVRGEAALSGADFAVDPQRRSEFLRSLKDSGLVAGVSERAAVLASFRHTMLRTLTLIVSFFVAFSALTAFGIVFASARITLSEREREFAILASLGFGASEVERILELETAVLLAFALPLGALFGRGLAWLIVQRLDTELYRVPLVVGAQTLVIAVVVVAAAALASTWSVARHLRRLDLAAALNARWL
ncbi:MAG TPA: ABC transporter permease [Burkholderiales bacterium]